jgi:hypothetical protein
MYALANEGSQSGAEMVGSTASSHGPGSKDGELKAPTLVISRRIATVKDQGSDTHRAKAALAPKPRAVTLPLPVRAYAITSAASTLNRTYYAMSLVQQVRAKRRKLTVESASSLPFTTPPALVFMAETEPSKSSTVVHAWDKLPTAFQPLRDERMDALLSEFALFPSRVAVPPYRTGLASIRRSIVTSWPQISKPPDKMSLRKTRRTPKKKMSVFFCSLIISLIGCRESMRLPRTQGEAAVRVVLLSAFHQCL